MKDTYCQKDYTDLTPEEVVNNPNSYTGKYLKQVL